VLSQLLHKEYLGSQWPRLGSEGRVTLAVHVFSEVCERLWKLARGLDDKGRSCTSQHFELDRK
jgi:hypothetical protein